MYYVLREILILLGLRVRRIGPIADRRVEDPLMDERVLRFQAQVVAALALTEVLREHGIHMPHNRVDLASLIDCAYGHCLTTAEEHQRLRDVNHAANEAKHQLEFRSRM